ncbi:aminotransferase class V-fold PLP-dependent enzyme [Ruminiclostridium herbifermentans]|uniref:Aminotransferase class V-fold PLP-dependent enzyme n=1 Tax=Ruminiclostridium herbifermentans TaxID=2488810 RepID=A0A4U7JHI8_9FIRM|nr:aminotransferase class V-fold PLP-dependent enzyme [Ruminiclostridium herbifermentans]QNU66154.1 aminotransferase class V-fold PLP-dependent enzyme [Ruminiclostridium herbifermentans]
MILEDYFHEFRRNTIGYNHYFDSPYGKQKIVYADWTASGRLYGPIETRIINEIGPFVGNTHSQSSFTGNAMTTAYNLAKEKIKLHVNADENDIIIPTGFGMTSAVNKLQRILGLRLCEKYSRKINIPEVYRPIVFVTHMEHNSNYISWLETTSDVIIIQPNSEGNVDLDYLESQLKKYSTRAIKIGAFTACSNVTGIQTPYHSMAKLMHMYNGLCFVDFAASAPYVEINMHTDNPLEKLDAIYFSPHKFLGGPGAAGVLILDSNLLNNEVPDIPGGGTVNWTNPWGEKSYVLDIETREDGGTPGFLQIIKAALCLELKNKMDIQKMNQREEEILDIVFKKLYDIPGVHILAEGIKNRLAIISFYIDKIHYNLIVKLLNDRFGIQTRGGCSCAGTYGHYLLNIGMEKSKKITRRIDGGDLSTKPGWVRMSFHPTTTDNEVNFIIDAIRQITINYSKWQKDYEYNCKTNEFTNLLNQNKENIYDKWLAI